VRLAEAPSFGQSIFHYDPNGKGAKAYERLAREFLDRFEQ
jgi:chromosome partitioning protein